MERLFGIPMGGLAAALVAALVVVLAGVGALALRNRVFLRLGVRNAARRRSRTALIVAGLMLGTTLIAAALSTGDTMAHTVRSTVITSLGQTDELISARGAEIELAVQLQAATTTSYFPEGEVARVREALEGSTLVDGVAPAIFEQVSVQDLTSRQNEPRVLLFASDPAQLAGFGEIRAGGRAVSLADLGPGEVYLNRDAADELGAAAGDSVRVLAAGRSASARVRAIVHFDGAGTDGPALLEPLPAAQALLGEPGRIGHIMVSNRGGATSGAALSGQVYDLLWPTLELRGLEIDTLKQDGLQSADEAGSIFMSLFTTFGSFSIAAGILLIFLIFVMLAAERRGELGIARAVGTQRGHLVQLFLFEGVLYDLAAAAVGALLGIAVAWVMVVVLAQAMGSQGIEVQHALRWRSVVVAYTLGVLLTFFIVTLSAWRVSVLNIVAAVRNLPDPLLRKSRRRRWVSVVVTLGVAAPVTASGISAEHATPFMLGVSLALVGVALLGRAVGLPERANFTAAGAALVVWWLLPFDWVTAIAGRELKLDFSIWVIGGLMVVLGATWTIVYNADLLIAATGWAFGRLRGLAPVLRLASAYPLRSRFRTGVTLAMFTLVVYTLVVGTTTSGTFIRAADNVDTFGGGFDIRAETTATGPIGDIRAALASAPGIRAGDFEVAASQSFLPVKARQLGVGDRDVASYPLRGLDAAYLSHTTYELAAIARGYGSAADVWRAMRERPRLAVVDGTVVPRRSNWAFGMKPGFALTGFFLEDGTFEPVRVEAFDVQTGKSVELTVIGVLKDTAPLSMAGISTSQRTLEPVFGARVPPTAHFFALAPGVDADRAARALESAFLSSGMQAEPVAETLHDAVAASWTFNRLLLGFMGLGLVVGVAALGVISARAVVERRQQIGVLRSIGFQRRMVQLAFLLESSVVALTAILVGAGLGLVTSYNVISDTAESATWRGISMVVPWRDLALIFLAVYAVALLTTWLPARRAGRVYPAEALRYE